MGTLLDPSGAPVSREVLLRELVPGRTILVHYEEEPLWMERLLIASESATDRTGTGYWYVCTPDLDRYIEEVTGTGDWCDAVHMMDDMGNTPISLRGHCYRFAGTDYPDDEELIRWYHAGRAEFEAENRYCLEATRFVDFNGHLQDATAAFDSEVAVPARPAGRGRGRGGGKGKGRGGRGSAADATLPIDDDAPAGPGRVGPPATEVAGRATPLADGLEWALAEPVSPETPIGSLVRGIDVIAVNGQDGLVSLNGNKYRVEVVSASYVPAYAARRLGEIEAALRMTPRGAPESVRPLADDRRAAPPADAPGDGRPGAADDSRTLWVDFDGTGMRHKAWRDVVLESYYQEVEHEELPGPPSALHLAKTMLRYGDPRRWATEFKRDMAIGRNDRAGHELDNLCEVLKLAGEVDQLNLGGLVTIEKLSRRVCVIVDAYGHAAGGAPSWRMSSHYEGTPGHLDAIAPGLRQYGARCARDEADLGGGNVSRWKAPAEHGGGGGKGGGDQLGGGVAGGGGAKVEKGKKGKGDVKGQGGAKGTPPGPANA